MPNDTPYEAFLDRVAQIGQWDGFDGGEMPEYLYPFQRLMTAWAIRKGRAALFADCGLGKTPMQLTWARAVAEHTGGRVLVVAPLAVSAQTVREGAKFGIDVTRSDDGKAHPGITTTNYERLHLFSPGDFVGVVCDESSAIKAFHGKRREIVTSFMKKHRYRLLATATAAPNDWVELGTASEALGELNRTDMLSRFFKNDESSSVLTAAAKWVGQNPTGDRGQGWRLKGHAVDPFWRWVASWARACRRPSDLGFDDGGFILPTLTETEHLVDARKLAEGCLFDMPAVGLSEQREEARRTLNERCEKVAKLVDTGEQAIAWCHLNAEGDTLAKMIPDAVQVAGSHSMEYKEQAIADFIAGNIRVLVSKPKIFGWGLNLQMCRHLTFFPSHSYEAYYQAVRRCWRFGQDRPVTVDVVTTKGGAGIMKNMQRKAAQADEMFSRLVRHMHESETLTRATYTPVKMEAPSWISQ